MAVGRTTRHFVAVFNTISPTRKTLLGTGAVVASVAALSSGFYNSASLQTTVSTFPSALKLYSVPSFRFFSSSVANTFKMGSTASSQASPESFPKGMSNMEWRTKLNPEQFRILREKGTEMAGTGKYNKHYPKDGIYTCAGCDSPLYKATTKFDSGCGWPAFFDAIPGAIDRHSDRSWGMERIEITCKNCGGHLGHVFKGEGFNTLTNERHCVNSVSINFDKDDAKI
ncbi:related to MXR2 - Methionine-R-sulfoxide reductase [Melanopsichium pennsylvanicum]|uniref:Peptide-methionine (R)-S-oxide reductase n=2 Tax=Melanopsichium pennsylvanicum TaxID=63383 RepID=A0AAJ4XII2_9BASI|nr:methionine-r-sulfoxide reductase [Melanopsichium pennsylvanicum 4]SNX83150.1 related to MXR2 - Methionine-R-sulfoxide reductase [Melanopsichium pennsylvanicum]